MGHTANRIANRLRQLFPPGDALGMPEGSNLYLVQQAAADELLRVYQETDQVIQEAFPSEVEDLLSDWEVELGLPDSCYPAPTTDDSRRIAIEGKYAELGGQSPGYYIQVAAKLGFAITIEEPTPFYVGVNGCLDPIGGTYWRFVWIVHGPVGSGAQLSCIFGRIKPSHTRNSCQES